MTNLKNVSIEELQEELNIRKSKNNLPKLTKSVKNIIHQIVDLEYDIVTVDLSKEVKFPLGEYADFYCEVFIEITEYEVALGDYSIKYKIKDEIKIDTKQREELEELCFTLADTYLLELFENDWENYKEIKKVIKKVNTLIKKIEKLQSSYKGFSVGNITECIYKESFPALYKSKSEMDKQREKVKQIIIDNFTI
jgi:hypothetical protein